MRVIAVGLGQWKVGKLNNIVWKERSEPNSMRVALRIAVLVGIASTLAILWRRSCCGSSSVNCESTRHHGSADIALPEIEDSASDVRRDHVPFASDEAAENTADAAQSQLGAAPTGWVPVEGTVIVCDSDGIYRPGESGSLEVAYVRGSNRVLDHPVVVSNGHFQLDVPKGYELEVNRVHLGGRLARVRVTRHSVEPVAELLLEARWEQGVFVDVLDAETSAHVDNVTIVRESTPLASLLGKVKGALQHPGRFSPKDVICDAVRPPIVVRANELSQVDWSELLWIGSQGYAWKCICVDYELGGHYAVRLDRGADLEVWIAGDSRLVQLAGRQDSGDCKSPRLRLRQDLREWRVANGIADSQFHATTDDPGSQNPINNGVKNEAGVRAPVSGVIVVNSVLGEENPIILHGLTAGDYLVSVEVDSPSHESSVLGQSQVSLRSNQSSYVSIELRAELPSQALVVFRGSLYIPVEWGADYAALCFREVEPRASNRSAEIRIDVGDMRRDPSQAGVYYWDAGLVPPGRYAINCIPFAYGSLLDTGECGRTDVRITIAGPASAVIRIVDQSGIPIRVRALCWRCYRDDAGAGNYVAVEYDEPACAYVFRAPAEQIELQISDSSVETVRRELATLRPGTNYITVHTQPLCKVLVFLEIDGVRVPWNDHLQASIEVHRDGENVEIVDLEEEPNRGLCLTVDVTGHCELIGPDLRGYRPVRQCELEFRRGELAEVTIQFVRQ